MVEAVSLNRVLPPKSKNNDGLYRNNAYNKRLTKTDLRKFIKSLAFGVSLNDYTKVKEENSKNFLENQQLKQELEELKVKVADLTSSVRTHEATMCLLEDTYNSFGMDTSLIPSKVEELHEILDSK